MDLAQALNPKRKEQLAYEVFHAQPNMLSSVLALLRFDITLEKIDFALDMLFICFLAMKESGLTWPVITEDNQDHQLRRFTAISRFADDLLAH